ncbi:MAG: glycosyltransferase family 4 protein [Acidobacteriaceae bacterium]|nr:glycosyltransferase family 4 protein [Acidobacteriaceae bacterium]
MDERKIFKLAYTTDVERFASVPLARQPGHERRLLYVGQLIERKGLTQFVQALARWADTNAAERVEFVLAGEGPLRETLERLPVPENLQISFIGPVAYSDLPKLYGEAGVFAFPTLVDTWGVVVNEAMAAGLPVLGSVHAQAVFEMVRHGYNGWTFHAGDQEETFRALDHALRASPAELDQMREYARQTALSLTPQHVTELIDDAIQACVTGRAECRFADV